MKCTAFLASALGLLASASAIPLDGRQDEAQTVHLTFHGGPAQYSMAIPADGTVHPTSNYLPSPLLISLHGTNTHTDSGIAVSMIEAPDYNAYYQCKFYNDANATLAPTFSSTGVNQIYVGPPTPITSVSCLGMCVYTYGVCFENGMNVGPCCSGYCAATRCRPWVRQ